jgi:hypothetical protein
MTDQAKPTEQEQREAQRQRYLRFAHKCVANGLDALAATYFRAAEALEQPQ